MMVRGGSERARRGKNESRLNGLFVCPAAVGRYHLSLSRRCRTVAALAARDVGESAMDRATCLLVLEPHDDTRRLVARLLRERGFEVATAPNECAALALAAARGIDAAVIDTSLPDVELRSFVRRLRFLCNDAPLIATTTAIAAELSRVKAMPFHRVLLKPYGLDQLMEAVGAATQERCACA